MASYKTQATRTTNSRPSTEYNRDWETKRLGDFSPLTYGESLPVHERNSSGNVPVFGSNGIVGYHDVAVTLGPTIVIGRKGSIGRVHFSTGPCWPIDTTFFVTGDDADIIKFKYYVLSTLGLDKMNTDSAVPGLNRSIAHAQKLYIPPLREQRAIATALSDVDSLLDSLEVLIAKKQVVKEAAMQQLLTGRTRLPGFGGEWETKLTGKLGKFVKGNGITRADLSDDGLPCVLYGELYTQYNSHITAVKSKIRPEVARKALQVEAGDLLFTGSGETSEDIGRCAAYLGESTAYVGGDIIVLTLYQEDPRYFGYLMNHSSVSEQKARMGHGGTISHINAHSLSQIQVRVPPLPEQCAIAAVLSDMDDEIAALERRREKTEAVKRGMMQELLTGRVRLAEAN